MSSERLIRPALVRRAAAVSAGALALCLSAVGTSYADALPAPPPVPSPDNVVTTVDQTVTSVTGTDPGLTTPGATTPGTTTPGTTAPPSTTQPAPKAPSTTTRHTPTTRTVARHAPARTAHVAAPSAAAPVDRWTTPTNDAALSLPPATAMSAPVAAAPAMAPLLIPQATHPIAPAAALLDADKHSGSPVRGIMLTLAIAAALALGYEHGRLARQGVPR